MFEAVKKIASGKGNLGDAGRAIVDPIGITDPFFKQIDKPDTSGEEAEMQRIMDKLEAGIPLEREEYKWVGDYKPEMLAALPEQGRTQLDNVSTDPQLRGAQMQALQALQERSQTGYNVEDQAAMSRTLGEVAQQERASREALMANMQARGQGGSGAELAQQLAAQQGAATRANTAGLEIAADGRRRALESVMQSGQLGGQMRSQDYSEQARRAEAQDAINRFNTQQSTNRMVTNNQLANSAGQYNHQGRQGVAQANTGAANTHAQTTWGNQAQVAGMRYGKTTNDANRKLTVNAQEVAANEKDKDRLIQIGSKGADYAMKGG